MRAVLTRLSALASWQINALGALACAALLALWYFAGFTPLAQANAAREAQEADLAAKRATAAHLVEMREAHKKSLKRIQEDTQARSIAFKPLEQSLDRINELSKAASAVGLTLDEVKPGQPAARARCSVLPIHLSGSGSYPGIVSLLHDLRSRFPDTGVKGFELKGGPQNPEKPARFTLDLVWYAAKLSTPPAQTEPAPKKS